MTDANERLGRAIAAIAGRHGLGEVQFRYPNGSCPVFAVGDEHVVKLYEPRDREHFETEREVLGHLSGALPVATPALRDSGECEGWFYIAMARLPGVPLRQAWDGIPGPERLRIAAELGRALAALHALPTQPLTALHRDFAGFLAEQRRMCVERQARHGLEARWLEQIEAYLAAVALPDAAPVLLHTEIMREHVLVDEHSGTWRISGLIDFEPAMIGHPEYELASVGLFVSEGDATILGAVLDGYGVPAHEQSRQLAYRCMVYALLHRYSKLTWYLDRMPPRAGVTTLHALATQWWPLG